MKKKRTIQTKRTPAAIAALIADRFVTLHLSDLQGILDPNNEAPGPNGETNDGLYEELLQASNPGLDALSRRLNKLEVSVGRQLPAAAKPQLIELLDGWSERHTAREEAAYLLGMVIGRRLVGGAL